MGEIAHARDRLWNPLLLRRQQRDGFGHLLRHTYLLEVRLNQEQSKPIGKNKLLEWLLRHFGPHAKHLNEEEMYVRAAHPLRGAPRYATHVDELEVIGIQHVEMR